MRFIFTFSLAILLFSSSKAQQPVFFASHPSLSPDGKTVVFSYNGDIWKADVQHGEASRLTGMQGVATHPRISPDGKWLAFSSNQLGNMDVYLMPLSGGDVVQLSHHSANDEVSAWSWDSQYIYFTSGKYNRYSAYQVNRIGGTAKRLFGHYFNMIHDVVEAPNGELFFSDTWESKDQAHRKGYKGAFNPEIQSYNPTNKVHRKYTDYPGKDFWTSLDENGNIYFVSDQANGEYNLYTFRNGEKTALTQFDRSIKRPSVSANGEKVVFEKDYQLYIYDVAGQKTSPLLLHTTRSNTLQMAQEFTIDGKISNFDASPDGKKIAFVSRGELFVSDVKGKFIQKIDRPFLERVMEVKWLKDNKTLVFTQTFQGFQNLFTVQADNSGELKQLTTDQRNNRSLALDSKREQLLYLSGRDEVRLLNVKSGKSEVLVKDEIWAVQSSSPSFSPNDEFALFTAYRSFEQDVFIHHLKTKQTTNLTNTSVTESDPVWSPDGKYIYVTSSLTKPAYPFGLQNPGVYRMALDAYDKPYRSTKFEALFDRKAKKDDSTSIEVAKSIKVNTDQLMDRIERISPSFGSQYGTDVFQQGDKTFVFFTSDHDQGKSAIYRRTFELFEEPKTEKVMDANSFDLVSVDGHYYALSDGNLYSYDLNQNKATKVNLDYQYQRDLAGEFSQMYYETWAGLDENFYDENFHGKDWAALKLHYATYLPFINNRSDLRVLLNDMLGELNASHTGFYSTGKEEGTAGKMVTNETGILFHQDKPFQVERVVAKSNASMLSEKIEPGDILTHVNGLMVQSGQDRDSYFSGPTLHEEMTLTFLRGGKEYQTRIHPQNNASLRDQLYDEWIQKNKERTEEWGKHRIAYSHMKNMGSEQLEVFLRDMVSQENKDALILDLRYNTGGNVHDEVLKFLSQRPYLKWKYRGGSITAQGPFGPAAKPIVLLVNEQSLSDAEMTAAGFKALGLGTIVGTETYRWIIFTSAKSLVDGSSYRIPSWGTYTLEGADIELEGVRPDVHVENSFLNRMEDQDPQLQKAVDLIMQQLN